MRIVYILTCICMYVYMCICSSSRRRILATCIPSISGCSSGCNDTNVSQCLGCASTYYLDTNSQCQSCSHPKCTDCTSATNCNACMLPLISNGVSCVCPPYQYEFFGICLPCPKNCTTCINNTHCTACDPYYTLKPDNTGCEPCVVGCHTCSGPSACSQCKTYYVSYGPLNQLCKTCDPGYFWVNGTCQTCIDNCKTCDSKPNNCTSCISTRTLLSTDKCGEVCLDPGTYFETSNNTCCPCHEKCEECNMGSSNGNCAKCKGDYWRDTLSSNTQCRSVYKCSEGKFRNITGKCELNIDPYYQTARFESTGSPTPIHYTHFLNSSNTAVACDVNCGACDLLTGTCTRCNQSYARLLHNKSLCVQHLSQEGRIIKNGVMDILLTEAACRTSYMNKCMVCKKNAFLGLDEKCESNCLINQGYDDGLELCYTWFPKCSEKSSNFPCQNCEPGYFLNSTPRCEACHPSCKRCTGPSRNECLECHPRFAFIAPNTCELVCQHGEYYDMMSATCLNGTSNCLTYSNDPVNCTSCHAGIRLVNRTCTISVCNLSQYWNSANSSCSPCDPSCTTCVSFGPSGCTGCHIGFNQSTSPGPCLAIPTPANCLLAYRNGSSFCMKTEEWYYVENNELVTQYFPMCNPGSYFDYLIKSCLPCETSCATCTGPTNSSCSLCASGYVRVNGICTNDILGCDRYAGYTIDALGTCQPCSDSNCLVCPNATQCEVCKSGMGPLNGTCTTCPSGAIYCQQYGNLNSLNCHPNQILGNTTAFCKPYCLPNQYLRPSGNCYNCSDNCEECQNAAHDCARCRPGDLMGNPGCREMRNTSLFGYYNDTNGDVVACPSPCRTCDLTGSTCLSCIRGHYLVGSDCLQCDDICLDCEGSPTNCTRCHIGFKWDNLTFTCTQMCESYEYFNTTIQRCLICPPNCKTCNETNPNKCNSCHLGMYLDGTVCKSCFETCETCTNFTEIGCTSCKASYQLQSNGSCIRTCLPNSYLNFSTYDCHICNKYCGSCAGPTAFNCTSCSSGFTFVPNNYTADYGAQTTGYCKRTCEAHKLHVGPMPNNCFPCHFSCATCSNLSPYGCLTCRDSFYQQGGECLTCHRFCATCNGPSIYDCTSCPAGKILEAGYCRVPSCSADTYLNHTENACLACHFSCSTCTNGTSSDCITCSGTRLLLANNTCIDQCTSDKFYDTGLLVCSKCDPICLTCDGHTNTSCLTCKPGEYLQVNKTCLPYCDIGSMPALNGSMQCVRCYNTCATCNETGMNDCLTCYQGSYLYDDRSCRVGCNPPMYVHGGFLCSNCYETCWECNGPNINHCTSCVEGERYLNFNGKCLKVCSPGFYCNEPTDSCEICHSDCEICTGQSNTDCLICANGLVVGPSKTCVVSCGPRYYPNSTGYCHPCHWSCEQCTSELENNCTKCIPGYFLLKDNSCNSMCSSSQYPDVDHRCQNCHPTCLECSGPSESECTSCFNPVTTIISENNQCADCLNLPDNYPQTCDFNVALQIAQSSGRSRNIKASITIKIGFLRDSQFTSRLTPEILSSSIKVNLPNIKSLKWVHQFRIERGEILLDLYFSRTVSEKQLLTVLPQKNVILTNQVTGEAELMFRNNSASVLIGVVKAPNADLIDALTINPSDADKIGQASSVLGIVLTGVAASTSSGIGGPLIRLFRSFKLISRLRLINIYFGPYLEMFLSFCNTFFKIGGNPITRDLIASKPDSREKLEVYQVTVITTDAIPWLYVLYFAILAIRIYRSKVRNYAWGVKHLTMRDSILNSIAEACRVAVVSFIAVDLFFYSLHAAVHIKRRSGIPSSAVYSYILSCFFMIIIPLEFINLFLDNSRTTFPTIRRDFREFNSALARLALKPGKNSILPKEEKKSDLKAPTNLLKVRGSTCSFR